MAPYTAIVINDSARTGAARRAPRRGAFHWKCTHVVYIGIGSCAHADHKLKARAHPRKCGCGGKFRDSRTSRLRALTARRRCRSEAAAACCPFPLDAAHSEAGRTAPHAPAMTPVLIRCAKSRPSVITFNVRSPIAAVRPSVMVCVCFQTIRH